MILSSADFQIKSEYFMSKTPASHLHPNSWLDNEDFYSELLSNNLCSSAAPSQKKKKQEDRH